MSETMLALLITVIVLLALAAWVPLLHAVQRLTLRSVRPIVQEEPPVTWQEEEGREVA